MRIANPASACSASGCQWLRKRASLRCFRSSGSAASTAAERGKGDEVVIGGQQMLGDDGIGEARATGRHPEALLQSGEGQVLATPGLLKEGGHQLKEGHPHRHIEGLYQRPPAHSASLRKQPGRANAITAGQQLLLELTSALIWK